MYGTVARIRVKPGAEGQLMEQMGEFDALKVKGFLGTYVYQMDSNPNEYYLAVAFNSKEDYATNAQSPEQDARYRRMVELLEGEPEWHDGEIVHPRG